MVDRDCPFCKRAAKILRAKILRGWRLEKDWFGSGSRFTISRLQRFVLFDLFFPAGVWDRETNIENWKPGMQSCARDWMISKMSEWLVERVRCICDDNSVPQTTCWNFKVHAVPMRAWKVQEVRMYRAKEESARVPQRPEHCDNLSLLRTVLRCSLFALTCFFHLEKLGLRKTF